LATTGIGVPSNATSGAGGDSHGPQMSNTPTAVATSAAQATALEREEGVSSIASS